MSKRLIGQIMVCCSVQIPTAIALPDHVNGFVWLFAVAAVGILASIGHALYMGEER